MERITVKEMRDILSDLIDKGHSDKYISIAEYYISKEYNVSDDIWNSVYFGEIYYDDIPITDEQENWVKDDMVKTKSEHPELFVDLKGVTFKKQYEF